MTYIRTALLLIIGITAPVASLEAMISSSDGSGGKRPNPNEQTSQESANKKQKTPTISTLKQALEQRNLEKIQQFWRRKSTSNNKKDVALKQSIRIYKDVERVRACLQNAQEGEFNAKSALLGAKETNMPIDVIISIANICRNSSVDSNAYQGAYQEISDIFAKCIAKGCIGEAKRLLPSSLSGNEYDQFVKHLTNFDRTTFNEGLQILPPMRKL